MGMFDMSFERRGGWPIIGRMIGTPLDADGIRRREMEIPLHKAELGAIAVNDGVEKGDDELRSVGVAMVAAALIDIEEPGGYIVPVDVVEEVSGIAKSVLPGEVTTNPYIAPDVADKVLTILEEKSGTPAPSLKG